MLVNPGLIRFHGGADSAAPDHILLESSDDLLMQDGSLFLLE
jgi:hypothetical protein